MQKTIYGTFSQYGTGKPSILQAFGDSYISLGFSDQDGFPIRTSEGVYEFITGDELPSGDYRNVFVSPAIHSAEFPLIMRVEVIDTMKIRATCVDTAGRPCDVHGIFSIVLTLNVEG